MNNKLLEQELMRLFARIEVEIAEFVPFGENYNIECIWDVPDCEDVHFVRRVINGDFGVKNSSQESREKIIGVLNANVCRISDSLYVHNSELVGRSATLFIVNPNHTLIRSKNGR